MLVFEERGKPENPEKRFLVFSLSNKSTLFNKGDTQQYSTDKPVALEFLIELEIRNVGC